MAAYKILLLQPPIQDFYDTAIRLQPIGLCYLKAVVKKFLPEFEVVVKDYHQGWGRQTIPLPKELSDLREYYAYPDKSPFSSFYHYYHFGASFEDIAQDVANEQPDIIGISSLFSPYYREVIQCAQAIKHRNIPIIVGGSHVSADPEAMLQHDCIDFIIRGEGERPLVEFLTAWVGKSSYDHAPNLGFKHHGKIVLNPIEPNYPLGEIPFPDFSDFPPERYQFEGRPLCFLITSRGCPYRCSFCSVHLTFGHTYRKRSVDSIMQEMQHRYVEGYRVFDFEDDNLTFDAREMKRLCEKILSIFPEGELELLAMNGLSSLDLDGELLHLMKQAGFSHLNLSLVTADQDTRTSVNRPHALEKYLEIVRQAAALDFDIVSYQILGLPQENLEAMIHTLVINAKLPVLLGASLFYVTPGSPIARDFPPLLEADIFKSRSTAMAIETAYVSRDDLFTLFLTTRILNFLKGLKGTHSPSPSLLQTQKRGGEAAPYAPSLPRREGAGGELTTTMPLADALRLAEQQGGRTALGVDVFRKLFADHTLYAVVGKELKPIQRFKPELFFRFWSQLEYICTQEHKILTNLSSLE
jgi:radical SAM superfamily enzyme YgiQ (UPF0313 family)